MKPRHDPLTLTPHWHVDCRIEAELPEDNIVGKRFLVNVVLTAIAAAMLLFTGWLGYVSISLRSEIRDWEKRLDENRSEVREIQRMQQEYAIEADKIDQAYALVRPRFYVSDLIANLGRTRPTSMAIDSIEWSEGTVVMRGNVAEAPERATRLLGEYVKDLQRDERIRGLFRDILLTDLNRGASGGAMQFEVHFLLKPAGT